MKIDGSGQRKTQRGVCSRAHGKRAGPSGYKLSRAQASFWPVFDTATLPTSTSVPTPRGKTVWNRCQTGLWSMLRPDFGTAILPTGTSVASSRGKTVWNRCQTGLLSMLRPVFGTATPPTGASVAFSRSHYELVYRIVAFLGFVKFTWNEPLLIIK